MRKEKENNRGNYIVLVKVDENRIIVATDTILGLGKGDVRFFPTIQKATDFGIAMFEGDYHWKVVNWRF